MRCETLRPVVRVRWRTASSRTRRDDTSPRSPARRCGPGPSARRAARAASRAARASAAGARTACAAAIRPGVGSMMMVTRSMAAAGGCDLEIEQRQRAQRRTSRIGDGSSRRRACTSRVTSPSCDVQHRRAAIAALEPRGQRLEQPREHERQRLEPLDRPLEIERRLEPLVRQHRHERPRCPRRAPSPATTRPPRPSRADRSAGGSAASSPSVLSPQRFNTAMAACASSARRRTWVALSRPGCGSSCSCSSTPSGMDASASAAPAGGTTVSPGRASASTSAAIRVGAIAVCTCTPRDAASRRISAPIALGEPNRRDNPRTSIDTRSARCCS